MRRTAAVALLLGSLSGCFNLDTGPESGGRRPLNYQPVGGGPPTVPGVQGPYGTPVAMAAPYNSAPPGSEWAARQMMAQSMPLGMVQSHNPAGMMGGPPGFRMPATPVPPGGLLSPPGMPFGPSAPPGGMGGNPSGPPPMLPGPGMTHGGLPPGGVDPNVLLAQYALNPATAGLPHTAQRTQVRFLRPTGMAVSWYAQGPDGRPTYSTTPIETPGKYNFLQGARYRLKLTNIPGRPGVELYPTLEVVQGNHKTDAFLAHSSVPVEFTEEDFKQIAEGNYVVKVIYLPDPQFQDVAGTGTGEILSTRLEPGQDPIQEALRRGSILLIIRMGNIDEEAPNTPPLASPPPPPAPGALPPGMMPPGMMPPGGGPPGMVPPRGGPPLKFGPTQPGVLTAPLQVPFWGMGPKGPFNMAPNAMPPGVPPHGLQPGTAPPPGLLPPGALPPGAVPGQPPPGPMLPGPFPPPPTPTGPLGGLPPVGPNLGPGNGGALPLAPPPLVPGLGTPPADKAPVVPPLPPVPPPLPPGPPVSSVIAPPALPPVVPLPASPK